MRAISATDLARHTREILDKLASHGEPVVIERNRIPIAELGPPTRTMTAAQALAGLALPALTPQQAAQWLEASQGNFDETVRDPWA